MRAILYRFSTYAKLVENIKLRGLPQGVDFEANVQPALSIYESLGFHPQVVSRIYKERPLSIVQDGKHTDIGQLKQLFKTRLDIDDKSLRSIVFKDPAILGKPIEELNKILDTMQQTLAINVQDTVSIIKAYPLIMRNFDANYQSFKKVFEIYAHFTDQQFGQLLVNTPYLFAFNIERLAPNFKMMYFRQFTTKEIQELLLKTADFLDLKPKQFERLYNHYDVLITDKRVLHQFLINNHKLMLLDPPFMIGTKINLFKNMKLSINQIGQCLQVCPAVFYKSVQSLQLKLKFFEKHFKVQIAKEPCFPSIFQFDYWTVIRPRLVIANTVENAIEICRMSEEDFIQKYNCAEKYKELMNEVPKDLPQEVDFVIKKYHRFCHDKIELLK